MNSPEHRKVLLGKDFTHMGTGAYGNYFTQTFIKSVADGNDEIEEEDSTPISRGENIE